MKVQHNGERVTFNLDGYPLWGTTPSLIGLPGYRSIFDATAAFSMLPQYFNATAAFSMPPQNFQCYHSIFNATAALGLSYPDHLITQLSL